MPVNTILDRFIFIVRPFAHENPSQSGASRKRSSNRRSLKTWAIRLHMDGDSILRLGLDGSSFPHGTNGNDIAMWLEEN